MYLQGRHKNANLSFHISNGKTFPLRRKHRKFLKIPNERFDFEMSLETAALDIHVNSGLFIQEKLIKFETVLN